LTQPVNCATEIANLFKNGLGNGLVLKKQEDQTVAALERNPVLEGK
jgi:hypothetical protein